MSVRRLELDYMVAPRRARWPGMLLLAISLAVAGALVTRYRELRLDTARLEAARSTLQAERPPPRAVSEARLDEQARDADAVLRELALPWAALVQALEQAATGDVAILQLQPDAQQHVLRLTAEARQQAAMLEYLRRLASTRVLTNVHVVNHRVEGGGAQSPVRFAVQASFRNAP